MLMPTDCGPGLYVLLIQVVMAVAAVVLDHYFGGNHDA